MLLIISVSAMAAAIALCMIAARFGRIADTLESMDQALQTRNHFSATSHRPPASPASDSAQ